MAGSVLIVVNHSELEHLSYADPRPTLRDGGIEDVQLVAASNVDAVRKRVDDIATKVLVFASNSLRDPQLRDALGAELGASVTRFLARDGGLLCLHQLRLTDDPNWVPPALFGGEIALVPRPRNERGSQGRAEATAEGLAHPALNFPVGVDIDELNASAMRSGPSGLYWHSIRSGEPEQWSVLVCDRDHPDRALLAERRFLPAGRMIYCSIQLDRIRNTELLPNLARYLRDGPYRIGLVRRQDDTSLAVDELRRTLSRGSSAAYVHELEAGSDTAPLRWAVTSGMHSSLVLAAGCHATQLPADVAGALSEGVRRGRLRVLEISDASGHGDDFSFAVVSRESDSIALLRSAVSRMRLAIATGLADGSLWTTFEGLHCLEELDDGWWCPADDLAAAVKDADRRDIGGSYDETFVATAALAWMRSRVHGKGSAAARACLDWLKSRWRRESMVDVVRVATILSHAGMLPAEWRAAVRASLVRQARHTDGMFELDLLACLNCALALGSPTAETFAGVLAARVPESAWFELPTTADCVSALVRALAADAVGAHVPLVREAALLGARHLRERLAEVSDITSIGCAVHARAAAALYRFDEIVGVSVGALVDAAVGATTEASRRDAAQAYDEAMVSAREAIRSSEARLAAVEKRYEKAARLARWHRVAVATACLVTYFAIASVISAVSATRPGVGAAWAVFADNAEVNVALVLAMAGPLVVWVRSGWRSK